MKLPAFISPALALPAGILAVIVLMVVPIPALMLDLFFVLNIALSVSILMAAMNAQKPLDFSSFPSVLLFATLMRLALNVASTRIVLLNGHEGGDAAGKVIEAFGAFLIGGNFAVGLIVFIILTIINMVVVTKGAGRVSEVTARFTLDALPGKQMAIDSDLAAGLMTAEEAKARRREIATEADFYGSMDGASKFVKGDAIAALLILIVNVIAGLVLGMSMYGLSAGEAGSVYVTLAVGDALVASIPALLLSIAAAVIVTRVSDARNLTDQIGFMIDASNNKAAVINTAVNPLGSNPTNYNDTSRDMVAPRDGPGEALSCAIEAIQVAEQHLRRDAAPTTAAGPSSGGFEGGAIAHLGPPFANDLMDAPTGQPVRAQAPVDGGMAEVKVGVAPRVRRRRSPFKAPDTLLQFRQNRRVITFFLN